MLVFGIAGQPRQCSGRYRAQATTRPSAVFSWALVRWGQLRQGHAKKAGANAAKRIVLSRMCSVLVSMLFFGGNKKRAPQICGARLLPMRFRAVFRHTRGWLCQVGKHLRLKRRPARFLFIFLREPARRPRLRRVLLHSCRGAASAPCLPSAPRLLAGRTRARQRRNQGRSMRKT